MLATTIKGKKLYTGSLYIRHRKHAPAWRTDFAFSLVESLKCLRFLVFVFGEEGENSAPAGSSERDSTAGCSDRNESVAKQSEVSPLGGFEWLISNGTIESISHLFFVNKSPRA